MPEVSLVILILSGVLGALVILALHYMHGSGSVQGVH